MSTFFQRFLALFFLCAALTYHGEASEEDFNASLLPQPPPGPKVLGIPFGKNRAVVETVLTNQGLAITTEAVDEKNPKLEMQIFSGTPKSLFVREGMTYATYFDNKLVQLRIQFQPTYENFLLIRNQVLRSLGTRFSIKEEKESVDKMLNQYLASLESNEFGPNAEAAVTRSILKGTTFWFYEIEDRRRELGITFGYYATRNQGGKLIPRIQLSYSLQKGLESLEKEREEKLDPVLPR